MFGFVFIVDPLIEIWLNHIKDGAIYFNVFGFVFIVDPWISNFSLISKAVEPVLLCRKDYKTSSENKLGKVELIIFFIKRRGKLGRSWLLTQVDKNSY